MPFQIMKSQTFCPFSLFSYRPVAGAKLFFPSPQSIVHVSLRISSFLLLGGPWRSFQKEDFCTESRRRCIYQTLRSASGIPPSSTRTSPTLARNSILLLDHLTSFPTAVLDPVPPPSTSSECSFSFNRAHYVYFCPSLWSPAAPTANRSTRLPLS